MPWLINHFSEVRIRATGSGILKPVLYSLDDVNSQPLVNFTLSATTDRQVNGIANFKTMRARLELKTTEIDETFLIRSITIFVKPSETAFPQ